MNFVFTVTQGRKKMIDNTEKLMHAQFDHMYHFGDSVFRKLNIHAAIVLKYSKERESEPTIGILLPAST